ncbi:MoxR-like ATPase [Nostoc flagelliforme CCNUN1]|uniref:MoxR-like ATPase n=1 Tax=Nostoc flagelliforme CCNUN1 TaxID=2038116 RepID=A0A2K8SKZ6_9NOSO|nr:MoxR family ATPase [Nostoc flagelliforme]AUB35963.1 MoxR-like ATPase [Nostoc flagelliforme CCNUN1]
MSDETLAAQASTEKLFNPIFKGTGEDRFKPEDSLPLPPAPTWRRAERRKEGRGKTFQVRPEEIEMVNAALYLRRPLLVTGKPGTGKTSLAYAIANELGMGEVLYWPITTRTTLRDGLYLYDAISRLQDANSSRPRDGNSGERDERFDNIGNYIRLGPLGTALVPAKKPRILIVDEIDKSDIDLPNDLLYVFEEGAFEIPELVRIENIKAEVEVRTAYKDDLEFTFNDSYKVKAGKTVIIGGKVVCEEFPLMILTSNGERDFPAPFLRRCVRLTMAEPDENRLGQIVNAHLQQQVEQDTKDDKEISVPSAADIQKLIKDFMKKRSDRSRGDLATDQLLNAVYLLMSERDPDLKSREDLINRLWKHLSSSEDQQSDSSRKR